jgi:hypothetical protein
VAEPLADDLDRDPVLDEQAAVGVAEIVEADRRHCGVVDDAAERFVDRAGMDGFAVSVDEHPGLIVDDADCSELGGLVGTPAGEDGQGGVIELDRAAGVAGLAASSVERGLLCRVAQPAGGDVVASSTRRR